MISFFCGQATPNKPSFFKKTSLIKKTVRSVPFKVHFKHVGREGNKVADWLTNVPRSLGRSVDIMQICPGFKLGQELPFPPSEARDHVPMAA